MSEDKPIQMNDDELAEQISLAALEFLSPAEVAALPRDLVSLDREAVALLAAEVNPVAPPPGLRVRLMNRVAAHQELQPAAEVRTFDGGWRTTGLPGIDYKPLYHDKPSGMFTQLLRMQPGARYPRHRHHDDEQCLVLEGDVRWGEIRYLKGDFVTSKAGTVHPTLETEQGNVLLIISGHNEFVHDHAS